MNHDFFQMMLDLRTQADVRLANTTLLLKKYDDMPELCEKLATRYTGKVEELIVLSMLYSAYRAVDRAEPAARVLIRMEKVFNALTDFPGGTEEYTREYWQKQWFEPLKGKLYKMWYTDVPVWADRGGVFYAESTDARTWKKPELGLVEIKGSRANNCLLLNAELPNVFLDPRETDPEARFKMLVWRGRWSTPICSRYQSYSGRCASNSSVQSEWVMPSMASD